MFDSLKTSFLYRLSYSIAVILHQLCEDPNRRLLKKKRLRDLAQNLIIMFQTIWTRISGDLEQGV